MSFQFLEVSYGDNDFGYPIEEALKRLFYYINKNNNGIIGKPNKHFNGKTTAQIFYSLHRVGALKTLFEQLYILEYVASGIEFKTRGLYWAKTDWEEAKIENPSEVNYKNTYLSFRFNFRRNDNFLNKWQNCEHAYLNLGTGAVNTF